MHVNSLIRLFKHKFDVLKTNIKSYAQTINWKLVKTKINSVFQSKLNYLLIEVSPI